MRFNPKARIDQSQTEHRAPGAGGGIGGSIGGGRLTVGGLVVAGLVYLVAQFTGVDVSGLVTGLDGESSTTSTTQASQCETGADAAASDQCAIDLITTSVQDYWARTFADQVDGAYTPIKTVTFSGRTASGCGTAAAEIGPFYCPNDRRVYLDVDFMDQMLEGDLGARGGPFALAYVVAHEYGHYVEDQLGFLDRIRTREGPRSDSVKVELMADCLAGMWARDAERTTDADGQTIIENITEDDIARAVDAAQAVGDDRIQQGAGAGVNPEVWTHGSAEQRVRWFNRGLTEGSLTACNTFAAGAL